jgi:predicted nucleic-acid-binding Zn-ribbon protein
MDEQKCKHEWDKSTGIFKKGIPHVGIKGKWVRTCVKCGCAESYSKGMFTGWFTESDSFFKKPIK